ncbi:DUF21 domain-containing protein [Litorivicinus lipolyticus]|uniref:Magnesium and cobalt efflux protein CorC n=1 Tax=Litorivicinus lipolyticus TaxID=418701 RepID=A0A5Q2QEK8_9GAMM|nr:HlyC/CorC family transporter [Litorivicinus lipolyticus]QGG80791.1 DUF21 domain-containing protein [Litorivicinus lipolyticus]
MPPVTESDLYLLGVLLGLLVLSAFFSSSETGMMSLNRLTLNHNARIGNKSARRVKALLDRPDRLIGVILIGNNFVNILASAIATVLATHYFGEAGIAAATLGLTLLVLIFAEVTPKTLAVLHPERIAYPASWLLTPLLKLLYPLVWVVNAISNGLLRLFGVDTSTDGDQRLSRDELKTVVWESGHGIPKRRAMVTRILDLEEVAVEDIMVTRGEMFALDLDEPMDEILDDIRSSNHTRLPVHQGDANNILGILHLRSISRLLSADGDSAMTKERLHELLDEPYFIPEGTPLHTQLFNFQKHRERMALVVDEYGDLEGLVTIDDILEEIVGDYTTDHAQSASTDLYPQDDGSWLIDAATYVRDINKELTWTLPTDGPKTLNGLIVEALEMIPDHAVSLVIAGYRMEVLSIRDQRIRTARIWPAKKVEQDLQ